MRGPSDVQVGVGDSPSNGEDGVAVSQDGSSEGGAARKVGERQLPHGAVTIHGGELRFKSHDLTLKV